MRVLCASGFLPRVQNGVFPRRSKGAERARERKREIKIRAEIFKRDAITHGGVHERCLARLRVSSIKWPERDGFKVDGYCARFIFDALLPREPTVIVGVWFSARVQNGGSVRIISFIRYSPGVASPVYSLRARLIADHLLSYPYAHVRVRVYVRA